MPSTRIPAVESRGRLSPQDARNTAELVELLRRLKEQSGLTYRQLEERAAASGEVLARSTLADVLGGRTAPRPQLLSAFVRACGEGERAALWLHAWQGVSENRAAEAALAEPAPGPVARPLLDRLRGMRVLLVAAAGCSALTALAWTLTSLDGSTADGEASRRAKAVPVGDGSGLPSGWIRIRPTTAPDLCLTDGRVQDRRYTPLVAVQRRCDQVAPQGTLLEPMGEGAYRIQWHHPDYGKGCLKAWAQGEAVGLLEPRDDCDEGSRFRIEPSGTYGGNTYVLRVAGQGCVGIRGSSTSEGVEAVMDRCVGKDGQVFVIEPAS
ncbi:helix-turn-helix domain-containing protein [Kitasatospora sp. NPDC057692]|uniref:helix-turn-helix domain-containing protein n=1 Tax=Kitasatospora sp. NPDC057692 TaxID=3346215 RepID=UPI0036C3D445